MGGQNLNQSNLKLRDIVASEVGIPDKQRLLDAVVLAAGKLDRGDLDVVAELAPDHGLLHIELLGPLQLHRVGGVVPDFGFVRLTRLRIREKLSLVDR